ncbi:membrane protein of unknown function [Coriobacterium glomerans PW2]|uniref:Phage holin family protein n=1 Tax=Coriobacterium glomerans (strain ATCC 49209 / DSM 20642 / JCM 10262 / PW2) TaxID=700015 RepID=F2NBK3_CORGP|nr:phage holin family protein [Coriobacterium glomerans]AEB06739.1 membrane protein of unknown function [Coriobacterium glomerans PW2]
MRFLLNWITTSLAIAIAVNVVPGIVPFGSAEPWMSFLFVGLCLGIVNAFIKPIVTIVSLPFTLVTLGIFQLFINSFMFELASWLSKNLFGTGIIISSFSAAFLGALAVSVISRILHAIIRD